MDDKNYEKEINQALGRITLGSMMLGAAGWELGKLVVNAIKMAVKGKAD